MIYDFPVLLMDSEIQGLSQTKESILSLLCY